MLKMCYPMIRMSDFFVSPFQHIIALSGMGLAILFNLALSAHKNKGRFCNEKKIFICITHCSNRSVNDSLRSEEHTSELQSR